MNTLQLIGRILFGTLFILNGVSHFVRLDMLAQYAGSKGVPVPEVAVIVTGLMMLLGGLAVVLGYKPKVGLWLLVAFLIPTALLMHNFWAVGAEQQTAEMSHFLKNVSLAGGALMLIVFATDEPWPYSLGRGTGGSAAPGGTGDTGGTGGIGGGTSGSRSGPAA